MSKRPSRFVDRSLQGSPSPPANGMSGQQSNNTIDRPRGSSDGVGRRSRQSIPSSSSMNNNSNNNNNNNGRRVSLSAQARVEIPDSGNNNGICAPRSCCRIFFTILGYFVLLAVLLHNTMITNEKYDELLRITALFDKVEKDNVYLGTQVIDLRKTAENCTNKTLEVQDDLKACQEYIGLHCPLELNTLEMEQMSQATLDGKPPQIDRNDHDITQIDEQQQQHQQQQTGGNVDTVYDDDSNSNIGVNVNGDSYNDNDDINDVRRRDDAMDGLIG